VLRLIVTIPAWEDYLTLAFDEIRQFDTTSIQVMRRLRAALTGSAESTTITARVGSGGALSQASRSAIER
jgi:hypothetical protein